MFLADIQLFIRFWCSIDISDTLSGRNVSARDCRLFSPIQGELVIALSDGRTFHLYTGSCLYLPSGTTYYIHIIDHSLQPKLRIVNFDFTRHFSNLVYPLPYMTAGEEPIHVPEIVDVPYFSDAIFFQSSASFLALMEEGEFEYLHPHSYSQTMMSALLLKIITLIVRELDSRNATHLSIIDNIIDYISDHYSEPLTNSVIASVVSYHPNYINSLFVRRTGKTLRQYLLDVRIQHALTLLLSTDLSICDIAFKTGFSSQSRFDKVFASRMGFSPSSYRTSRNRF